MFDFTSGFRKITLTQRHLYVAIPGLALGGLVAAWGECLDMSVFQLVDHVLFCWLLYSYHVHCVYLKRVPRIIMFYTRKYQRNFPDFSSFFCDVVDQLSTPLWVQTWTPIPTAHSSKELLLILHAENHAQILASHWLCCELPDCQCGSGVHSCAGRRIIPIAYSSTIIFKKSWYHGWNLRFQVPSAPRHLGQLRMKKRPMTCWLLHWTTTTGDKLITWRNWVLLGHISQTLANPAQIWCCSNMHAFPRSI